MSTVPSPLSKAMELLKTDLNEHLQECQVTREGAAGLRITDQDNRELTLSLNFFTNAGDPEATRKCKPLIDRVTDLLEGRAILE